MPQFNPRTIAIAPTTHLIEASAGTGKTYGIASLFTRLILQGSAVERVVVVTFTEAAAGELKSRLRKWLNQTLQYLQTAAPETEAIITQLVEDAQQNTDNTTLIQRLQVALHAFDTAAIYTIHGFCLRVLSDQALLCGMPFDIQIGATDPALLLQAVQDFWRKNIANNPDLAPLVVQKKYTPQNRLAAMQAYSQQPLLHHALPPEQPLQQLRQQCTEAWHNLQSQLIEIEAAFWQLHPKLNGNSYRQNTYQTLFQQLHDFRLPEAFSNLMLFSDKRYDTKLLPENLRQGHKKGAEPDPNEINKLAALHHFILAYQQYEVAENEALIRLDLQILQTINTAIEQQKRQSNQRNFNDLLLEVHQALHHNPHRQMLAKAMAAQCDAVLIDEFQDTDPLQYAIFRTAFIDQNIPVFLVGDPKQAIYAFRGADIHAYLQAKHNTAPEARHSLTDNYRSSQGVVDAVAALFSRREPFVLPDIPFTEVQAKRGQGNLTGHDAALHIRWLNAADSDGKESKETLRQTACEYCANDIANLLNRSQAGYLKLNDQALQPQDIAVLVRNHKQAQRIRRALYQHGIPSVLIQKQSVFQTDTARAIAALLAFLLEPQRIELLRFILTGILYRFNAAQLDELNHNPSQIDGWIQLAQQAAQTWHNKGIFSALMQFAQHSQLETQLIRQRDERSLTDFWHIAELLANQAFAHTTPQALLTWLQHKIQSHNSNDSSQQDSQLRLESDENRVKIATMHASKGLEYPIVFCPFIWDEHRRHSSSWHSVRRDGEHWLIPEAQLTDHDKTQQQTDQLGEDLRLLYVALTRARESLYLYTAAQNKSTPQSPLSYLLASDDITASGNEKHWKNQKDDLPTQLKNAWQTKLANLNNCQWHEDPPPLAHYRADAHSNPDYRALTLPTRYWQHQQQSSFTALSRSAIEKWQQQRTNDRLPEANPNHTTTNTHNDTNPRPPEAPNTQADLFANDTRLPEASSHPTIGLPEGQAALLAFPRGAQAGVCLHRILELADFRQSAASQRDTIAQTLQQYGYHEASYQLAAETLLDAVRHSPLIDHTRLCDLAPQQQATEWGFMMHAQQFSRRRLIDWFAHQNHIPAHAIDDLPQLDFPTLNGFLNGFIDWIGQDHTGRLIVADFKSNHLGNHPNDYHTEAMSREISHHQYALQALIYAIAAARHFRHHRALPDTIHIRYLFMRGLNPHGNEGIWQWDIPTASLQEWLD